MLTRATTAAIATETPTMVSTVRTLRRIRLRRTKSIKCMARQPSNNWLINYASVTKPSGYRISGRCLGKISPANGQPGVFSIPQMANRIVWASHAGVELRVRRLITVRNFYVLAAVACDALFDEAERVASERG